MSIQVRWFGYPHPAYLEPTQDDILDAIALHRVYRNEKWTQRYTFQLIVRDLMLAGF